MTPNNKENIVIPDRLPILTSGLGNAAEGTACAMSAVSWLEGGKGNTDTPECVHPVIARAFVRVNDAPIWTDDEHRTRTLWPLIARAMGTAPTGTDHERKVLAVRLAVFSARHVLPLVRERDRQVCEAAIRAAEGWCDGTVTEQECRAADYAADYDAAAHAAAYAASAASADPVAFLVYAAAAAASAASADPVAFLVALLDEHDRVTGRTATPLTDLRGLDTHVPGGDPMTARRYSADCSRSGAEAFAEGLRTVAPVPQEDRDTLASWVERIADEVLASAPEESS